ncbi:MAG TPA: response regulator [Terriglobales bacterium]|nr:response regulator [Terriglobales bacterium]
MDLHRYPCNATSRTPPRTILLVEDEPFVREATRIILESAGFEVFPTPDAVAAASVYKETPASVDLLMTDMILPGRTGEDLGRELRRHSPSLRVLITSGYSNVDQSVEDPCSNTFFLAKPYSRRSLVEKINEIFCVAPLHQIAGQAG